MWVEWMHGGKPTLVGVASGAVAGLATVTAGAGFVGSPWAVAIGVMAGGLCHFAVVRKGRMDYDDSLVVVGIHGVGGVASILAMGLFASEAINASGAEGLLLGYAAPFGIRAITVASVALISLIGTWLILNVVDLSVGLRISPKDEWTGLDLNQHNERAYSYSMAYL